MMRPWMAIAGVATAVMSLSAQDAPRGTQLLARRYVDGERVQYLMKGLEDGTTYEVRLTATTRKDASDHFVDEFAWSDLVMNGAPRTLSPSAQQFRFVVTTEGATPFQLPDLSKAPGLIGPVTDLMTFYADLFLARHQGTLQHPGDHLVFRNPQTASWADGRTVITGEDHVDFDITLSEVDQTRGVAVLSIKHIPPAEPRIRLAAEWMHAPVADTPNNWVMVRKTPDGYSASVGKEIFDVTLRVSLLDGKLLSATMDNPLTGITRDCVDVALTQCGAARDRPGLRRIEMTRLRD